MTQKKTFLVFGGTGQTGQHFVAHALKEGHRVRAVARNPAKFAYTDANLDVREGAVTDLPDLEQLVHGADYVVSMLGDAAMQRDRLVNTEFVRRLVPAMRREGVTRFLYQAGGLSRKPGSRLSPVLWAVRNTIASSHDGQHRDNEAVMQYLTDEAGDLEWMVHRAAISSNGASKGVLRRSPNRVSIATFVDCATYNYRALMEASAIHTCDTSAYSRSSGSD